AGAGELLAGTRPRRIRNRRGLTKRQLHRPQAVTQGARVGVGDLRCGGRHQTREGVDELARLIKVGLRLRVFGEPALDGRGTEQVHRDRVDEFDGGDVGDFGRFTARVGGFRVAWGGGAVQRVSLL